MNNIYAKLRALIDSQNIKNIQALIKSHPKLNYDDISPNRVSTLGWALMPEAGKEISLELIEFLVNYKKPDNSPLVNPTQNFLNCRPVDYLRALGNKEILDIVQEAENNYKAPAPVDKSILKKIAKDKQNVHLEVNVDLSYNNTIRLYQHYVIKNNLILDEEKLKTIREEIESFCKTEKESVCKDVKHPRERQDYIEQVIFGLNYCFNNSTVFKFETEKNTNISPFSLTVRQLLGLNWIAAQEMGVLLLPEDADNHQGLISRKKAIISCLHEIATAYGKNSAACIGGARIYIGCALAEQHILVKASEGVLTNEEAYALAISILGKFLKVLSTQDLASYWAVLRYLNLDHSTADEQKKYQLFIAAHKKKFFAQCLVEAIPEDMVKNIFSSIEEGSYPVYRHPDSVRLCRILLAIETNQLEQFSGNITLEKALETAKNLVVSQLLSHTHFKALLKEYDQEEEKSKLAHHFIEVWLQQAQLERQALQDFGLFVKGKEPEEQNKLFIIETFIHALFLMKKENWMQTNPQQALWLNTLLHKNIINLMSTANDFGERNQNLLDKLLLNAIEQGIILNLNLQGYCFDKKDLRHLDFSNVNLNGAVFKECHLPLSGTHLQCDRVILVDCSLPNVEKNITAEEALEQLRSLMFSKMLFSSLVAQFYLQRVTDQKKLLEYSEEVDSLLFVAAKYGCLNVIKAIMESEHCGDKWIKNDWQSSSKNGDTLLMAAAEGGFADVVEYILSNQYCKSALLEHHNVFGDTALSKAQNGHADEALKITELLLHSEHFTPEILRKSDIMYGRNALSWSASDWRLIGVFKLLIESQHYNSEFLEQVDHDGNNAMMMARICKNNDAILYLLQSQHCSKKLYEEISTTGDSILIEAVSDKDTELVQSILESEYCTPAFLEYKNKDGKTALKIASEKRYWDIVRSIVQSKHCSPELLQRVDNEYGFNPLMMAIVCQNLELALVILNQNCSPALLQQADNKHGLNPLMMAIMHQNSKLALIILNQIGSPKFLEQIDNYGYNALMIAIMYGNAELAKAILESAHCTRRLFEQTDANKNNLLMIAASYGQIAIFKTLLNNKHCSPDFLGQVDNYGFNILARAIKQGNTELALAILESVHCTQSLIEQTDANGNNLLMIAESLNQIEVFKAILNHKHCSSTLLEQVDFCDSNVLMLAIMHRNTELSMAVLNSKYCTIKVLEEGAPSCLNAWGLADYSNQIELCNAILHKEKQLSEPLEKAECNEEDSTQNKLEEEVSIWDELLGPEFSEESRPLHEGVESGELGKRNRNSFFSAQPFNCNNQENEPSPKRPYNPFN